MYDSLCKITIVGRFNGIFSAYSGNLAFYFFICKKRINFAADNRNEKMEPPSSVTSTLLSGVGSDDPLSSMYI